MASSKRNTTTTSCFFLREIAVSFDYTSTVNLFVRTIAVDRGVEGAIAH